MLWVKIKIYKEAKIGLIVTFAIVVLIWGLSFLKGNITAPMRFMQENENKCFNFMLLGFWKRC